MDDSVEVTVSLSYAGLGATIRTGPAVTGRQGHGTGDFTAEKDAGHSRIRDLNMKGIET